MMAEATRKANSFANAVALVVDEPIWQTERDTVTTRDERGLWEIDTPQATSLAVNRQRYHDLGLARI